MKRTFAILGIALAAAPLAAQQSLIGFTARDVPQSSNITHQSICNPPGTVCPNALPAPSTDWAGGAAYSPMNHSVWHTQGTRLQELPLNGCQPICSMAAERVLGANSLASGLTIDAGRNEMYQLESLPGMAAVVTYRFSPAGPCPQRVAACRIQLPSAVHHAGAIAYDGRREVIWVASSVFNSATPSNIVLLYRRGDPSCQPFCRIQIDDCFTGRLQSIRAMAYDECREVLWVSDGRQTSEQRVVWSSTTGCPVLRPIQCCALAHPQGEFWAGFDVLPRGPQRIGFSCVSRGCPQCPNMRHGANGAPSVGNAQFALTIEDAPTGGTGFVIINLGPCAPIPFGCGRIYPALPAISLGGQPLAGIAQCDGSAAFPLPIPPDYNLCGLKLCSQGIVLCPAGGIGLTNGLEIEILP